MCGIAGYSIANHNKANYDIHSMIASISHRGPDDLSVWNKNNVALAHARLSIIDLSIDANQPQHFNSLHIVFNGEIFNYIALRKILISKGYTFATNSDTEVVLKGFDYWQDQCVNHFEGMFAFCIYDHKSNLFHLFRDRVGIKPLYYINSEDGFVFASEARALYQYSKRCFDLVAIQEYFSFGYIGKERTVYTDVKKLLPGHYMLVNPNKKITIKQYWNLLDYHQPKEFFQSENEVLANLEEVMCDAFSSHMVSDVPVGILLSGGVDSSLVTALLSKTNKNLSTFTMGFSESEFNEAPLAKKVSEHLGTNHFEKILYLNEAKKVLHDFYDIYDEPFADSSGIPTSILAGFVRDKGCKVVLSADGGDELFAGYERYHSTQQLWTKLNKMPSFLRRNITNVMQGLLSFHTDRIRWKNLGNKFAKLHDYFSAEECSILYQLVISNGNSKNACELVGIEQSRIFKDENLFEKGNIQAMMNWDFLNYLPDDLLVKMDRATMYHGVEGREPMLDYRIIESVVALPLKYKLNKGTTKYILKKLLRNMIPNKLVDQPKKGFSIPLFKWFAKDLDQMFEKYLNPEFVKLTNVIDEKLVEQELNKYKYFKKHGMSSNIERMWRILSFMLWWEKYHISTAVKN